MSAEVTSFPRAGFIIGPQHCRAAGPGDRLICLAAADHDGEHRWSEWAGCRVRVGDDVLPFGGFCR